MITIALKDKNLKRLSKAFKGQTPVARVGIIGAKAARQNTDDKGARGSKRPISNAELGAIHEYGGPKTEQRSFLRMPLALNLPRELQKSGAFKKAVIDEVIKTGSLRAYVEKFGAVGVAIVLGAFDTGGYGAWKPSNMKYKENWQTLVESHQLRDSITWEVKG